MLLAATTTSIAIEPLSAICGNSADFPANQTHNLHLASDAVPMALSVDMWFRFSASQTYQTLVAKDGSGAVDGDVFLTVFHPSTSTDYHLLMRIGAVSAPVDDRGGLYLCSGRLSAEAWHHVAINPTGPTPSLLVDGEPTAETVLELEGEFNGITCGDVVGNQPWTGKNPFASERDWMFGGSNQSSNTAVFKNGLAGQLDEIRFRSVPFTTVEAMNVYQAGLSSQ